MSFTPSPGTLVRLIDGREARILVVTPLGDNDLVIFPDSHTEVLGVATDIESVLIGEDDE